MCLVGVDSQCVAGARSSVNRSSSGKLASCLFLRSGSPTTRWSRTPGSLYLPWRGREQARGLTDAGRVGLWQERGNWDHRGRLYQPVALNCWAILITSVLRCVGQMQSCGACKLTDEVWRVQRPSKLQRAGHRHFHRRDAQVLR